MEALRMGPIRGSFTIRWDPFGCDGRGGYRVSIPNYDGGEVVPVPDEQAIERAAKAAQEAYREAVDGRRLKTVYQEVARAVLAAALEQPDA